MTAIEILNLQKSYASGFWRKRRKTALHPLNLSIHEGEIFGYLGPNGAGKTTTLRLLMGIIFPTGGSARILGHDMQDPRVKAQIGFLPEQPYFYDYLTAAELLHYYAQLSGVAAGERSVRVKAMLKRVGLAEAADVQLRKFSKGMLQRVGIAQAILHDPRVIFLDEPMSGLDPIGRREVRDLIQGLKDEGKTVFFSTHILSDAEDLCDRVAVLHQGALRGAGTIQELTAGTGGRVEIHWQGPGAESAVAALGGECRVSGDTHRAVVPEDKLDAALDALRRARVRILSVNPVRIGLEEYFMRQMSARPDDGVSAGVAR